MRKLLLGFAVGVVVSGLLFFRFDAEPRKAELATSDVSRDVDAGSVSLSSNLFGVADTQSEERNAAEGTEPSEAVREDTNVSPEEPRVARLRRELEEAQNIVNQTTAELQRIGLEEELAAQPVISPITLPPEFDWIADNFYREVFHERMQREQIDGAWAGATESQLSSFLYGRPELVSKYGPPDVRCHATQCEVTFIASGIFDDPVVASTVARSLFDEAFEEMDGIFDCGPGACWAEANSQGGVVTIFWGMTKDDNQPRAEATIRTALR